VLRTRWPALFASTEAKPLAIGVHKQILAELPDTPIRILSLALRSHCGRAGYVAAILQAGSVRYNLAGEPAGAVTEVEVARLMAERARLAEKLARRHAEEQKQAAKRAQQQRQQIGKRAA
jgi:ProP effector